MELGSTQPIVIDCPANGLKHLPLLGGHSEHLGLKVSTFHQTAGQQDSPKPAQSACLGSGMGHGIVMTGSWWGTPSTCCASWRAALCRALDPHLALALPLACPVPGKARCQQPGVPSLRPPAGSMSGHMQVWLWGRPHIMQIVAKIPADGQWSTITALTHDRLEQLQMLDLCSSVHQLNACSQIG